MFSYLRDNSPCVTDKRSRTGKYRSNFISRLCCSESLYCIRPFTLVLNLLGISFFERTHKHLICFNILTFML